MATNFPTSLDSLTNPSATDTLDSPPHDEQHADANDAIEALQAKVGVDSSAVTSSLDYKVGDHASRLTTLEAISHGKILQVVSTAKTDEFTSTSSSLADITGLSVDITPSSTSSKVLILSQVTVGSPSATNFSLQFVRDSTEILNGDTGFNNTIDFGRHFATATDAFTLLYLDSPATTSATTYKMQIRVGSGTVYVNRGSSTAYGGTSTITVMEVSA